jgi:O-antigen/teichoic acid export membrane protein
MIKKHSVLIGITISLVLLIIAISIYPGGTYQNKNSIGFDWTKNYISNLFETKALNGSQNSSILWAYFGMFFYSISCAIFFVNMSKKIPEKNVVNIIK